MALQINDLVASIRKDGVEAAQKDAQKIIADAKQQAQQIIGQAHKDADALQADAKREIAVRDQSARASLQQASRDVMLSLRKALSDQFSALLTTKLEKTFTGKELASLVAAVLRSGVADPGKSAVLLPQKEFAALAKQLTVELADEMKKGLIIRPSETVEDGFRIADKDGSGFLDFSDEELANLMKPYVSEELSKIVFAPAEKK